MIGIIIMIIVIVIILVILSIVIVWATAFISLALLTARGRRRDQRGDNPLENATDK